MNRSRWGWIVAIVAAGMATVAGLWFVTSEVAALESRQAQSQVEFARAETIRLALWRMDSWMTPRLAREAARSPAEYSAFYSPAGTVNRLLQSVPQGDVLSPSPLLLESASWIPIHFEWRADGSLTSPQIPTGNLLDLAEGQFLKEGVPAQRHEALKRVTVLLAQSTQPLDACVAQAEFSSANVAQVWRSQAASSNADADAAAAQTGSKREGFVQQRLGPTSDSKEGSRKIFISEQQDRAISDYESRTRVSNQAQQSAQTVVDPSASTADLPRPGSAQVASESRAAPAGTLGGMGGGASDQPMRKSAPKHSDLEAEFDESIAGEGGAARSVKLGAAPAQAPGLARVAGSDTSVGPLVATWLSIDPPELAFVRRVREGGEDRVQGFLVDWPQLSAELLGQVSDLMSAARLDPVPASVTDFVPCRLASVPAQLQGDTSVSAWNPASGSSSPAVIFAWTAATLALLAGAVAAWAGISFGDRQARFASSVTHELRTPLTTFQLYAEMLRDGMVTDEARRRECLETLCRESHRLTHLVENVLSLSRVERGTRKRESAAIVTAAQLEALVNSIAAERAASSDVKVHNELGGATLRLELDALSQVLANLIENAAKYGRIGDASASIEVSLASEKEMLVIKVCDGGPGIDPSAAAAIWRPFDRAGAESGAQPGLGLGLSVSRALAQSMQGSLRLVHRQDGRSGACFEVRLPSGRSA